MSEDAKKNCAAWIARQPEFLEDYISFREQALLYRLWGYRDAEAEALRARIAALEAEKAAQLLDLQEDDTLIVHYPVPISAAHANQLRAAFQKGIDDARQLIIMGNAPKFTVLRRAKVARFDFATTPPEG